MERKFAKGILFFLSIYIGTIYMLYMIPSIIRYLMHRAPEFEKPEPYVIFNSILFLFALIITAGINITAFIFTFKLF